MKRFSFARNVCATLTACAAMLLFNPTTTAAQNAAHSFEAGKGAFLLDGKPFIVKAAELHYPRIPREYWEHRIQMCRALGMNTVCLYVFWNLHEPSPGQFNFSGNADVREFCRLAQKNGMWVILRPGPYVCAEWEMGGLPWWLLKHDGVTLRDDEEPFFLERVALFEKEVGKQLADMTVQNGGPIIMVQVENEYGSYAEDKTYISKVKETLKESGFNNVALFQCDWASNFTKNGLQDLTWTMNFGTNAIIDNQFKSLKELRPDAPLMCSEYWSGWFDKWGARHETRPADKMVSGIAEMLSKNISFSLYMTHGGTSFGHWAGANSPGFAPDVTSYDYDAPINEQGAPTPKFFLLRDELAKYADNKLPDIPEANPVGAIEKISNWAFAPFDLATSKSVVAEKPMTFEQLDLGWGYVLYKGPEVSFDGQRAELEINDLHDYAVVLIDDKPVARADRASRRQTVELPRIKGKHKISILVEAMGRINFGRAIEDRKGITNTVRLHRTGAQPLEITNWKMFPVDDEYKTAARTCAKAKPINGNSNPGAGFYRATFKVDKPTDSFLNLCKWGKGQVYVNGHPLGRFWSIGPQQTLYLPAPWLKVGDNEIIIADIIGPRELLAWGQDTPELNLLQPETDPDPRTNKRPDIAEFLLAASGEIPQNTKKADIALDKPVKAKLLAIEILSTWGDPANGGKGNQAAIAEIIAFDKNGNQIDRGSWDAIYASSQDTETGNNTPPKAFDLQESTFWQSDRKAKGPHLFVVDLGKETTISKITVFSREDDGTPCAIRNFNVKVK